jgi:hypothetical protein
MSLESYVLYLRFIGPSAPHKDMGWIKGIPPCLLYSVFLGDEWSALCSGRFLIVEKLSVTHCISCPKARRLLFSWHMGLPRRA